MASETKKVSKKAKPKEETEKKEKKEELISFDSEYSGKMVKIVLANGEIVSGRCVASRYFIKIIGNPVKYINKASVVYIELVE
jgi:hypothetical protein